MAHPWASDCLSKTSSEAGYGAKRKEKRDAKYGNELHLGSMTPAFIPLVMEHFGRWGSKAENYLNVLAK